MEGGRRSPSLFSFHGSLSFGSSFREDRYPTPHLAYICFYWKSLTKLDLMQLRKFKELSSCYLSSAQRYSFTTYDLHGPQAQYSFLIDFGSFHRIAAAWNSVDCLAMFSVRRWNGDVVRIYRHWVCESHFARISSGCLLSPQPLFGLVHTCGRTLMD